MKGKGKLLKKIHKREKVRFSEIEKLFKLYGFEINKSSGSAHWVIRNKKILDETGNPKGFSFWRPHNRKEIFLNHKQIYLDYLKYIYER